MLLFIFLRLLQFYFMIYFNLQTLLKLNLEVNWIGASGMKYIADALEKNRVNNTTINIFSLHFLFSYQTLTALNLTRCNIGPVGTKYLANALMKNQVIFI